MRQARSRQTGRRASIPRCGREATVPPRSGRDVSPNRHWPQRPTMTGLGGGVAGLAWVDTPPPGKGGGGRRGAGEGGGGVNHSGTEPQSAAGGGAKEHARQLREGSGCVPLRQETGPDQNNLKRVPPPEPGTARYTGRR